MLNYLIRNRPFCSKSLYTFHCCFSIQNANKTVLRSFKFIALKPVQLVNLIALRILRGFTRFRTMYYDEVYFDPCVVNLFYQRDNINPKEWLIVYNCPVTNLYSNVFRICFCFVIGVITYMSFDYTNNGGKFTDEFSIKLHKDFIILGIFGYFILSIIFLSAALMLRINSLNISRIYLNRNDPSKLLLRGNRFILLRPLTPLNRKDIRRHYNEDVNRIVEILKYFLNGHVKLGHLGNYAFADEGFRTNSFRSYILNESEYLPITLKHLDLKQNNKEEKLKGIQSF